MIRVDSISFAYGHETVLRDVSLEIADGEVVGIIGPSGSGKTTLLRVLLGELTPFEGTINSAAKSLPRVGYVPQLDTGERNFPLTVEEMVLLGRAAHSRRVPWFDRGEKAEAHRILQRLGIGQMRNKRLDQLSGGQFQRALIARALMSRPSLLVLDEPTSGIDLETRRQVLDLLHELSAEGYTVVLTTHDLNWVAAHLPRVVCLNGAVVADGSPRQVLTDSVVRTTYGAEMEVILHNGRPVVVDVDTRGGQK